MTKSKSKPSKRLEPGTIVRKRPIAGRGKPPAALGKPLLLLHVGSRAPFQSVVQRTSKALEKGPGGSRCPVGQDKTLEKRIDALRQETNGTGTSTLRARDWKSIRQRQVVLLATGNAIGQLVRIGSWFQQQPGYVVEMRTRDSNTIDDIILPAQSSRKTADGETNGAKETAASDDADVMEIDLDDDTQDVERRPRRETRIRNVSCLEVSVRLA